MFEIIMKNVGRGHAVILNTPDGMYPEPCMVSVPLTEVAQVFTHDWLDSSILHWFAMHLYEFPKNMHCAVLDPFLIDATKCLFQPDEVVSHITKVAEHHKQRRFLLVPYIQSSHWVLIVMDREKHCAYIVDSAKSDETDLADYLVVTLLNNAFHLMGHKSWTWDIVNCMQQRSTWECGFMVIKHMKEFITTIQNDCPRLLWNNSKYPTKTELDQVVSQLMSEMILKRFHKAVTYRFSATQPIELILAYTTILPEWLCKDWQEKEIYFNSTNFIQGCRTGVSGNTGHLMLTSCHDWSGMVSQFSSVFLVNVGHL